MGDRNIDTSIRKPRQARGTPFYKQRNYYALAIIGLGGLTGIIYNNWSGSRKLQKDIEEEKFEYSDQLKNQIVERRWGNLSPEMQQVLTELREKREIKEDIAHPQSWLSKLITSVPQL